MIFSCFSGGGSTVLSKSLKKAYKREKGSVSARPDGGFVPIGYPVKRGKFQHVESCFSYPEPAPVELFHKRTGFRFDLEKSILENMKLFFLFAREHRIHCFMANLAALGLFSRSEESDVVFHIRHPLYNYSSYYGRKSGKGRTKKYEKGIESISLISLFAQMWNNQVEEYFRCKEQGLSPVLIRFEYTKEDLSKLKKNKILQKTYSKFDSKKSRGSVLSSKAEGLLRQLTIRNVLKLYEAWEV